MKLGASLIAVLLAGSFSLPASAALTELESFDEELAEHGVERDYSDESLTALLELLDEEVADLRARARAGGDGAKRLQRIADAVGDALKEFSAIAASSDTAAKAAAFPALKSLLYSLRSEVRGRREGGMLMVIVGILDNLSLRIPYLSPEERRQPLTSAEAALEAVDLVEPRSGRAYSKPEDLVGLSCEQVSQLDVRDDNYLWYSENEWKRFKARHDTAWKALEARIEARVSDTENTPYRLHQARRVLYFEAIKTSGTSPKVETEDQHGQEWTLKWGDEVQSDAIANRLYAELGGKFTDLVYVNQGPAEVVLVLDKADSEDSPDCDEVPTLESLKRCLLASKYEFDLSPYVVGHGVITEDTLRQEPFSSASAEKKKLLGRHFVTFNESLVEFQTDPDDFLRLGAAPLNSGGARSDRVKRGLVVFTYWVQNKDAKDANSKGLLDRESSTYVEYMHDLGASLGSLYTSGNPNLLKVGDAFVRQRGEVVRFAPNMLYIPEAFEAATLADALWMARKIVELPRETILAAVEATRWPDFQQQIMASRLIARRNAIARAFDLGETMAYDVRPTVVPLRTPTDRRNAVRRYHLSIATEGDEGKAVELLEGFMKESGIAFDDGQADFEDEVDSWNEFKGESVLETNRCEKSVLVALLERTVHPAGLARRVHRRSDDKPLDPCRPTKQTLGIKTPSRRPRSQRLPSRTRTPASASG